MPWKWYFWAEIHPHESLQKISISKLTSLHLTYYTLLFYGCTRVLNGIELWFVWVL